MYLHLDPEFTPFSTENTIWFEHFTFSGGEPYIKLATPILFNEVYVTHRIKSFNDFGVLLLAIDALKRSGVLNIHVCLPYFPGARQDRQMVNGEPLSVKVYADLLNTLQLKSVLIFDPHSDVTPAVVNNCRVISNMSFIQKVVDDIDDDLTLVSPDGGALKKVYKLSKFLGGMDVIECSKSRDVKTGAISGFKVYADNIDQKSCLIVDDICHGGGTFIGLAKALKDKGVAHLYLAVSHGIFSHGLEELNLYFDKIYCTNAFNTIENQKKLKQFKLEDFLNIKTAL